MRLFQGVITPTLLYGAEAWTLTVELENRLHRTQRQMIRMILHSPRRSFTTHAHKSPTDDERQQLREKGKDLELLTDSEDDTKSTTSATHVPPKENDDNETTELEPWTDWIRRCTHEAEHKMQNLQMDDWISIQRSKKWKWARKLALKDEFDWTTEVLKWDPTTNIRLNIQRRQGRPKTRWKGSDQKWKRQNRK